MNVNWSRAIAAASVAVLAAAGAMPVATAEAATVPVRTSVGQEPPLPSPLNALGEYRPLSPTRVLDTRSGLGARVGAVEAGRPISLRVVDLAGVPLEGVELVALNVTVTEPTVGGFLTVAPGGGAVPFVSNLNFRPGQTVANFVVARPGAGGALSIVVSAGAAHVVADVAGWFSDASVTSPGSRLDAIVPRRLLDTRESGAKPGPGEVVEVRVAEPGSGVTAVVLNLTATESTTSSFVTAFPGDRVMPWVSSLNVAAGWTRANLTIVPVPASGLVALYNHAGSTHLVVDLLGRFEASTPALAFTSWGRVIALDQPRRLIDSRATPNGPLPGGLVDTWGLAGLEIGLRVPVTGLFANFTATEGTRTTYLTIYPDDGPRPATSNVNAEPGDNVPNHALVRLGAGDVVAIYNHSGEVHYVLDAAAVVLGAGYQPGLFDSVRGGPGRG